MYELRKYKLQANTFSS